METVTLAGSVTLVLLLERARLAPDGAGADNVTVQFDDPGPVTAPGEQVRFDGTTAKVKLTVVDFCWPLRVAVTVTV